MKRILFGAYAAMLAIVVTLLVGCGMPPVHSDDKVYELEEVMNRIDLIDGVNYVMTTSSGAILIANAYQGQVTSWQVRAPSGSYAPVTIRNAPNPNNLRIWWAPANGSSRFVEAPAYVIAPNPNIITIHADDERRYLHQDFDHGPGPGHYQTR